MPQKNGYPVAGLIFLVILLTFIYIHASSIDTEKEELLKNRHCPSEYQYPISHTERHKIEQVIRDYKTRRSTNKSNTTKIINEIVLGALRGGLGGAVLGGEAGIIPGMIAFGTLGGILTWSRNLLPFNRFIDALDGSAY